MSLISKRSSKVRSFVGISCLPSSTKILPHEPEKAVAFAPGETVYVLQSSDPADLKGGPEVVALCSREPLTWEGTELGVGDEVPTKYYGDKKQLPSRRVVGIRFANGALEGAFPEASVPHWFAAEGEVSIPDLAARIEENRKAREAMKPARERGLKLVVRG